MTDILDLLKREIKVGDLVLISESFSDEIELKIISEIKITPKQIKFSFYATSSGRLNSSFIVVRRANGEQFMDVSDWDGYAPSQHDGMSIIDWHQQCIERFQTLKT